MVQSIGSLKSTLRQDISLFYLQLVGIFSLFFFVFKIFFFIVGKSSINLQGRLIRVLYLHCDHLVLESQYFIDPIFGFPLD